jgi:hypothetical protein
LDERLTLKLLDLSHYKNPSRQDQPYRKGIPLAYITRFISFFKPVHPLRAGAMGKAIGA